MSKRNPISRLRGPGQRKRRRGSVLMVATVLMVVAGVSTASWLAFVTQSQVSAGRDRERMLANYAAEAGLEHVVDYFNNPFSYTHNASDADPDEYTITSVGYGVYPNLSVRVFEPFYLEALVNDDNLPVDESGRVITNELFNQGYRPVLVRGTYLDSNQDSKVPTFELNTTGQERLVLRDGDGTELARVTQILLINPDDFDDYGDAVPDPSQRVVTKIIATGRSINGVEVQQELILRDTANIDLRSPGAIISKATASFDGNLNCHWGEVWVAHDVKVDFQGADAVPKESDDQWFQVKTEGWIRQNRNTNPGYADGRIDGGWNTTTYTANAANGDRDPYYLPYNESLLHANNKRNPKDLRDRENLWQHQDLDFPEYDYDEWKEFFLSNGLPYYFMDSAEGLIWGQENGVWVKGSYDYWFNAQPPDPDTMTAEEFQAAYDEYWGTLNQLAFIDTPPTDISGNYAPLDEDGVPVRNSTYQSRKPGTTGARMIDLQVSGSSTHSRGAMLIAANLIMTGQGNPTETTRIRDPEDPSLGYVVSPAGDPPTGNGNDSIRNVFHNGLLYCWGTVDWRGNRTIYGSIFTEGGYLGSGTPEVWYNYRLANGNWLNLNQSRVKRMQWGIRKVKIEGIASTGSTGTQS